MMLANPSHQILLLRRTPRLRLRIALSTRFCSGACIVLDCSSGVCHNLPSKSEELEEEEEWWDLKGGVVKIIRA